MRMTPLLLAPLLGLVLLGCSPDDGSRRTTFGPKPLFDPVVLPTNLLGSAIVPLPIDLLIGTDPGSDDDPDNDLDGTLAPAGSLRSISGVGAIDGWSTSAPLFFNLQGAIDVANAGAGIRIFNSRNGRELEAGVDFAVNQSPVSLTTPRLVVDWLRPLAESTRYLVAITRDLRAPDGSPAVPNELFELLRRDVPLSEQNSTLVGSLQAQGRPELIEQLEAIRQAAIRPTVEGLIQVSGLSGEALREEDMMLAWSFTTQSITPTLSEVEANASAQFLNVQDSGLTLAQAVASDPANPPPIPPEQNPRLFVGAFQLPYFLPAGADNILTGFWRNDGSVNAGVSHPALGAPCEVLLTPVSTTICHPRPQAQSTETVPVLLTRPQGEPPAEGWPVVVFLHGITGQRSQMLGIAGSLAAAGMVTIAIDQPLHGLPPGHPLRVPGTTERTFDADLDNDGQVDDSGTHFINPNSLLTSRDNVRQSVSDQIHLVKSLPNLSLNAAGTEGINPDRIHFLGHSLGGIVGGTLLGATADIQAASLAMPGGGVAKLLDASQTFGPVLREGLAAAGVQSGTDSYEIFLRIAQLVFDSSDPINWAARASADRAVHLIEILNDTVVPNQAVDNPALVLPGRLSGTRPLAAALGLPLTEISPPVSPPQVLTDGDAHIRLDSGNHGSLLQATTANPADDPAFVEIQRQVANFLASNGACLPIGGNCPQSR